MAAVKNPRKIYVANIARECSSHDLEKIFSDVGRIVVIEHKGEFAFVEYERDTAAEDACRKLDGMEFYGKRLVVEPYVYRGGDFRYRPSAIPNWEKNPNNRGGFRGGRGGGPNMGNRGGGADRDYRNGNRDNRNDDRNNSNYRNGGSGGDSDRQLPRGVSYRLYVIGLDPSTSYDDVKAFAKDGGSSVCYTDVYQRHGKKEGIIEYSRRDDYEHAIRHLDRARLNGVRVKVLDDRDYQKQKNRSRSPSEKKRSKSRSRSRSRQRRDNNNSNRNDKERNRDKESSSKGQGKPSSPINDRHNKSRSNSRRRHSKSNSK
jgi:RNA recognition motif-containing protein